MERHLFDGAVPETELVVHLERDLADLDDRQSGLALMKSWAAQGWLHRIVDERHDQNVCYLTQDTRRALDFLRGVRRQDTIARGGSITGIASRLGSRCARRRASCPRSPSSPRSCGPSRGASRRSGWATSRRSSISTPIFCGCATGWRRRTGGQGMDARRAGVRNRFTFDCAEWAGDELIRTHSNAGDNSGGEQETLMAFCLAGALSFNLASPESADNTPVFAQLMLDEAFSKSDPQFAQQALSAFRKFGFQLVIVATVQNATTIQPYIDSVVMVSKTEPTGRNARPVASVATSTISGFTTLRQEMRSTTRVPALSPR